ncbi:unnamed protein product [Heterobilharzia americana]|nr:unnamed protein product [Heterobilharzia americana]
MCPIAHAGIFYDLVFALFIHSFVVSHIYMEFLINVCSKCKWQFQFMNILLLFLFSSTINRLEAKTFVYNYVTNISENSYKEAVLDILSGRVYITPIILNEIVEESDEISKRLWHVTLIIDGKTSIEDEVTLNCLTLFDHKGLIDRIFISRSTLKKGVTEINIFKGLLSLFNIHHRFEPGIEIDSSGKCQVTYATTAIGDTIVTTSGNHRTTPDNIIIIDKEKTLCERLQRPIDVWNENSLSVVDFKEVREILTRYKYDKSTHQILEVYAYERQIHSFIDLSNTNYVEYQQLINSTGINLVTWQKLEFIDETDNQDKRIQNIVDQHYDFSLDEITEILFGSDYQTIHLGIVYPVSKSQTCSLNANLFTAFMNEDETSEKKKNANLIYLRQHIESYRDWLQNDAIGSIKSAEAILNLTSLLRSPPATEIQSIYRQLNTWRDHLIDILINCGTSTCLTIVFNRLNTLTHFVYSNQSDHDQHSLEVVKSKEMLFTKLWPSLSHIRRLNIEQVNQLYEACEKSIIIDKNYVCLMTLVNLNLREVYDFKQIIQHIQKLLDISNSKVENYHHSNRKLIEITY